MAGFGGLGLFHSFCRASAIRHFLQLSVRWPDNDPRGFHRADLFLAHVFSIVDGLGCIENTQCLIHNGLIPPLLGMNGFADRDTLPTFLFRCGATPLRSLQAAHDKVRAELAHCFGLLYSVTTGADTMALLTYGFRKERPEAISSGFDTCNHTPWQCKQKHHFVAVRRAVSMKLPEIRLRLFTSRATPTMGRSRPTWS